MPMRTNCAHYRSRTFPNGDSVSSCELNLAPDAPWRCPEHCPGFERRIVEPGWEGVSTFDPKHGSEPKDLEGAAAVLSEAESILNSVAPRISKQFDEKRAKEERKQGRKQARRARRHRIRQASIGRPLRIVVLFLILGAILFAAVRPSALRGLPIVGPTTAETRPPTTVVNHRTAVSQPPPPSTAAVPAPAAPAPAAPRPTR